MNPSVSLFLWAHDAQSTLEPAVAASLELLGDMAGRFEVVILDRQSSDETFELACELAQAFPQIRVQRTWLAPEWTSLEDLPPVASDLVLVAEVGPQFSVHELRQQCQRRWDDRQLSGHLLRRRLHRRRHLLATV